MATTFASSRYPALSIMRPDGESAVRFKDGRYTTDDEADIELLRGSKPLITELDTVEIANKVTTVPPSATAPAGDLAAFPFERRTYQRGNEPFVVLHLSRGLATVAEPCASLVEAFGIAYPASTKAELRFVTTSRAAVTGTDARVSVTESALDPKVRLELYRQAHVLVRTAGEEGDAFAIDAIAAGTPVIVADAGAEALAAALKDAEASYQRVSAQAAKAEKQLRAARR